MCTDSFTPELHVTQLNSPHCIFIVVDGVKLADEEADGFFRCAQYGAVYQPTARLNEMMLRVKA